MKNTNAYKLFREALDEMAVAEDIDLFFEIPKNPEHGDLSTNVAMKLSKALRKAPKAIAEEIISKIKADNSTIEKIEIAGPGFINVKFTDSFYANCLEELYKKADRIGKLEVGKGKKVNVEYVSVNPTGLLHLGHGRNACIGDTVANLYQWLGYEVTREYYFNNAGNQMNMLAKSIYARYMQIIEGDGFPLPEDGYHGEYIKEIAKLIFESRNNELSSGTSDNLLEIRKFGEQWCFEKITQTLERMKIHQDIFYNEETLYSEGKIEEIINEFTSRGLAYQKDGATWLAFTQMGLNDDRVIVKSTGEPTYRLPDIAYHREKFRRGYDILVDVFGSDHIATVPDVLAGVKSLGFDETKVKVLIHQFVTLTENGEQVKMSKRTGKSYTLDDLLDEVGADVVRFFLLMRGISTHLEFDLTLAREQSDKNPVFYLQYAHARICSVIDNAISAEADNLDNIQFTELTHIKELELIKEALNFDDALLAAGERSEPQILVEYLRSLASAFHGFYHECRIIGVEKELQKARLALAITSKNILKNGLTILGITAPERM
jgi:arginyl-tRNA synthetase